MTVTQAKIDALIEIIRARHMENVAIVAFADALDGAARDAASKVGHQRLVPAGGFAYPHAEIANMLALAQDQAKVATLYDVLAVALQRLGEIVER